METVGPTSQGSSPVVRAAAWFSPAIWEMLGFVYWRTRATGFQSYSRTLVPEPGIEPATFRLEAESVSNQGFGAKPIHPARVIYAESWGE